MCVYLLAGALIVYHHIVYNGVKIISKLIRC